MQKKSSVNSALVSLRALVVPVPGGGLCHRLDRDLDQGELRCPLAQQPNKNRNRYELNSIAPEHNPWQTLNESVPITVSTPSVLGWTFRRRSLELIGRHKLQIKYTDTTLIDV